MFFRPLLVSLLFAALWTSCSRSDEGEATSNADRVARELAAAEFGEGHVGAARAALAPLVTRAKPADDDLLRGAIIELADGKLERAQPLLERAARGLPESPAVHFNLGRAAYATGDMAEAARHFARARALAPEDVPTRLMLAKALVETDENAAEKELRAMIALGVEQTGSWHLSALYILGRLLIQSGRDEESQLHLEEFTRLKAQGLTNPSNDDLDRGNFGRLAFPPPHSAHRTPKPPRDFTRWTTLPELAGAIGMTVLAPIEDWTLEEKDGVVVSSRVGPVSLSAWGADGVWLAAPDSNGKWKAERVFAAAVTALAPFDLERDGDLDFWLVSGDRLQLWITEPAGVQPSKAKLPPLGNGIADFVPVDYDHDGDLDLLIVGNFGTRLWRDDGVATAGTYVDATADAGIDAKTPRTWCITEDFDTDQDVDLLLGGSNGVVLCDNLRGGKLASRSNPLAHWPNGAEKPLVADLDGDGRPDVWQRGAPTQLWRGAPGGKLVATDTHQRGELGSAQAPALADWNLDGALDGIWAAEDRLGTAVLSIGAPSETPHPIVGPASSVARTQLRSGDFDGDGAVDLARATAQGVELFRGDKGSAGSIRLALRGTKDNQRGVGAVVEVRAGESYRRVYWRGEPQTIGIGSAPSAAWIRVTWPNGVVQSIVNVPANSERLILQREGLIGSCPFLYTWNGERYEFVTDVLGITPLGLPMQPGMLVPPDHDEYVLIRGEQLRARDGRYELQITEELREVTYLDRVRLDVVDHPADVEIYPNEKFTFPPFPEPHTHTVKAAHAPQSVTGSDAKDWTRALAAIDGDFAAPFTPYQSIGPTAASFGGQFLGLATPHSLELAFDRDEVARAKKLRLVMTGWFVWTDASVNMASSRTPDIRFVPPMLDVPDGNGGWRSAGPPIGFPAGKRKSMVVDVTDVLVRDDPRLRLSSTLRLYWDSIRLAVDDDDAPLVTTALEPVSARLWERGFSRGVSFPGPHQLEWFDWDALESEPRWNQTAGMYTRLGDVLPLLGAIDDRMVIMGSGDSLALAFDASKLPPLREGWTRDFLLFLDGWGKDRDPNTLEGEQVEPMPFHGMTAYPYGPNEVFPNDEAHRAWRREWLTRPAREWIEPLAPSRIWQSATLAPEARAGAH
ncbi:MAG: FG-GAP-like repeat-containing protein [Planctomycetota bacterium]